MGETFQEWIRRAIEKAGGQSELARALRRRFPTLRVTPQAIQHLAVPKKGKKPAQASRLTPYIAEVVGLPVYGIASPTNGTHQPEGPRYLASPVNKNTLERAQEVDGVEFTKDALLVAKAFMDLPRNMRDEFKRKIETAALEHSSAVADENLTHLAAPRPRKRTAVKAGAPGGKRRHVPGTQ